jgi:multidrug efflux pump subunit AcrA (membrane-fusion protein)
MSPSPFARLGTTLRRAGRFQVAAVALALGCALGVGAASLFGTSPGDASAKRKAPDLPVPTARLVKQVLKEELQVPCQPRSQTTRVLPPPLPPGRPRVVTAIGVRVGQPVKTGDLLAVVSGVPTFAFVTRIPFYRDLGLGDTGPDVAALERALVAVGKLGKADSVFDSRTAAALSGLYARAGASARGLGGRVRLASSTSVPAASEVTEIDAAVGQVVTRGTPLMVLAARTPTATCRVPGTAAVSVGERLSIGVVRSVAAPDPASGQRDVVVALARPSASAEPGNLVLPLRVTKTAVLTVPAGGIWVGPAGSFVVRKVVDGNVKSVRVRIGTTAGGYVEISGSGLAAGDEVELHVVTGRQIQTLSTGPGGVR